MKIPGRIGWAVELLAADRGMRVLEVGCGRGFAARALTPSLGANGYVGLDRSRVAIQAARKLNAEAEQRGIAQFVLGELGEADVGDRLFDAMLTINVNAFWTGEEDAAAKAMPLLKKRGRMLLVYELPSPARLGEIEQKLDTNLRAAGFLVMGAARPPERDKAWIAIWARKG